MAKRLSKIKKIIQDIHAKTDNDRYSKPAEAPPWNAQQNITGGLNRFYVAQPSPLVLPWYTQDICSVRVKGS